MARYSFNLPDIGEGIAEAEIVRWHVAVGDWVAEDMPIADLMTDKATVEMETPVAGRVLEIAGKEGEVIAIGSALVVLETEETAAAQDVPPAIVDGQAEVLEEGPPVGSGLSAPDESTSIAIPAPVEAAEPGPPDPAVRMLASPAVRQRARALGIDLVQVRPAADNRIRHADLDAFLSYTPGYVGKGAAQPDEVVPVIGLRRRIAEAMSASKRHIPHFTLVEECDVTVLEEARVQLNGGGDDRPRLTLLPLLIAATCRALAEHRALNARYDEDAGAVTRHGAVHMGVATATANGLIVPVIRDAQGRNLWQLADEISRLATAARDGSASRQELSGSTFTISSLGPLGGVAATPVINRPEVAILAPGRIVERPAFVPDGLGGERVAKRKLMSLSLSCDHRVVDGQDAALFMQAVRALLEAPARLLAG
ncbi:branched-chain alpha-keto acid dehydrogenase subunit E2 [Croceibacterium mercuriale]|uniref:Dihydrolipoamide acetyltransferase component of pyruvate dehydrogenase complex n=1 Tax=Croceibacterium mercuriale TaxID=1572751 RepID=A0A0B2C1T6_9SPHN|nr:dihydrolipoamide acetyltransferase family protein [Croceibacterium mercuriale]KHL25976.1 branched-chain alpha-keto acid dehydrogenase subunit E2 [Croceibacterium mercuriale]